MSTISRLAPLDQLQHLHVLVEGKRDVELVHALALEDLVGLLEGTEQREPPVADVVAGSAVVNEPHQLKTQLAVLEQFVGHGAAEVASRRLSGTRFSPTPCRQRRSSTCRTASRDTKVSATLNRRNSPQTSCETSKTPRSFKTSGR